MTANNTEANTKMDTRSITVEDGAFHVVDGPDDVLYLYEGEHDFPLATIHADLDWAEELAELLNQKKFGGAKP